MYANAVPMQLWNPVPLRLYEFNGLLGLTVVGSGKSAGYIDTFIPNKENQ